jgi:hypothetical protein|eukprot:scaffold57_cov207-Alexandrium_tamarense.AAC.2
MEMMSNFMGEATAGRKIRGKAMFTNALIHLFNHGYELDDSSKGGRSDLSLKTSLLEDIAQYLDTNRDDNVLFVLNEV